jgi:hypothetical protein
MLLKPPFIITSRLLPGLRVGQAEIALKRAGRTADGRDRFQWHIDLWPVDHGCMEFTARDLRSGVGGGSLQSTFASLLTFLSAFAEARDENSDCWDLFPEGLREWAQLNSDKLEMLSMEIHETENLIEE